MLLKQETSGLIWAYLLAIHKVDPVAMESDELLKWGTDGVLHSAENNDEQNPFPVSYTSSDIHCFP